MKLALETRLPCPVCLGVTMKKTRLSGRGQQLVLDSCPRCGGIWFELGEVQKLRAHSPQALWEQVRKKDAPHSSPCHNCQAIIDRNAEKCGACGTANRINCPSCNRELMVETHEGLRLDVCRTCKGVWFDHVELEAIWKLSLRAHGRPRPQAGTQAETQAGTQFGNDIGSYILLDSLMYSPDLLFHGAHAADMVVQAGGEALLHAPEIVGAAAEGAAHVAGDAFEAIVGIIGGLFDG